VSGYFLQPSFIPSARNHPVSKPTAAAKSRRASSASELKLRKLEREQVCIDVIANADDAFLRLVIDMVKSRRSDLNRKAVAQLVSGAVVEFNAGRRGTYRGIVWQIGRSRVSVNGCFLVNSVGTLSRVQRNQWRVPPSLLRLVTAAEADAYRQAAR
jgi:hypothetical protein